MGLYDYLDGLEEGIDHGCPFVLKLEFYRDL